MIKYTKESLKDLTNDLITCIWSIFLIFYLILSNNNSEKLPMIGILIIFISITLLIRVRKSGKLLILVGVIVYINISIGLGDCICRGMFTSGWQVLRGSEYDVINAKSILLTIIIINLLIKNKDIIKIGDNFNSSEFKPIDNIYCFYLSIVFICISLIFGYSRSNASGTYVSNGSPLYEYAILIFMFAVYFSGMKKNRVIIVLFLLGIYVAQAFYYGDRSSSFMLILMFITLFMKKVNLKVVLLYSILGITVANILALYRQNFDIAFTGIHNLISGRGLSFFLSDTVGFSYYAGDTIIAIRDLVGSKIPFIIDFIKYIFLGGNIDKAILGNYSNGFYFNKGGGMYHSSFYFWGGFIGVIIGAIILVVIIKKVFCSNSQKHIMLMSYFTCMTLRWYLYGTTTFFRSTLFIFIVVYCLYYLLYKMTTKKSLYSQQNHNVKYLERN